MFSRRSNNLRKQSVEAKLRRLKREGKLAALKKRRVSAESLSCCDLMFFLAGHPQVAAGCPSPTVTWPPT